MRAAAWRLLRQASPPFSAVPVVDLRIVGVLVHEGFMHVPVRVRFGRRRASLVLVSVVLVVDVTVVVRQGLVRVFVLVSLAQVVATSRLPSRPPRRAAPP